MFILSIYTGKMLHFMILWVLLLQGTPSQSATISLFQNELYMLKEKCSSFDTTELFESLKQYTSRCSSSDRLLQINHLTDENRSDALCLLFLNNYINLCLSMSAARASINMSLALQSILPDIKKNKLFCSKLNIQPKFEKSVLNLFSTNKELCEKVCTDFYGEVLPMCSYSYLMLDLTKMLENPAKTIHNEKDTVAQNRNEKTINKDKSIETNVTEQTVTAPKKVVTETKNENADVDLQKLTPPHNVASTQISNVNNAEINLKHNKAQLQNTEHNQIEEKKTASNLPETVKPVEQTKKVEEPNKLEETKPENNEKINKYKEANIEQIKTNKVNNFEEINPQEAKNTQETNGIESSLNTDVNVQENQHHESTLMKNEMVPSSPVKNEPSLVKNEPSQPQINKVSTESTKIIDGDQMPEYEGDDFASDLGEEPVRKNEVKVAKPYKTDESEVSYPIEMDGDSYFFSYFMMLCIVFVLGYVGYHNKQKILAIIVEGRRGKRQTRGRRPNSANYHKLDSNLEEAVTSACSKSTSQVIY